MSTGQVLVPCFGSWSGDGSFSDSQFDSYVLQPAEDGYQTADGKVGAAVGSCNPDGAPPYLIRSLLFTSWTPVERLCKIEKSQENR